jgi:hypothetical protein
VPTASLADLVAISLVPKSLLIMRKSIESVIALLLLSCVSPLIADDVKVETVLTGLRNPTSVAIRPGGNSELYEVFVADSGARRVVKISSNEPSRSTDVITGFPDASETGKRLAKGNPFSLLFLDEKHLVAGIAGAPPEVRVYELSAADTPIAAEAAKQKVIPELPGEEFGDTFGSCVGLARTRSNDYVADMLFFAFSGSHHVNGFWKVPVRANMLGEMSRLEIKTALRFFRLTALAVSEQGYMLAVDDSSRLIQNELMFLNPTNAQVVLSFRLDLSAVSSVAYSPKSGDLYALATLYGTDEEGLFRLDDAGEPGERQIAATKIVDFQRPAAMAFGPEGALYVTTLGDNTKDDGGALLKVTGDF